MSEKVTDLLPDDLEVDEEQLDAMLVLIEAGDIAASVMNFDTGEVVMVATCAKTLAKAIVVCFAMQQEGTEVGIVLRAAIDGGEAS